jgi:hypothetical protein
MPKVGSVGARIEFHSSRKPALRMGDLSPMYRFIEHPLWRRGGTLVKGGRRAEPAIEKLGAPNAVLRRRSPERVRQSPALPALFAAGTGGAAGRDVSFLRLHGHNRSR